MNGKRPIVTVVSVAVGLWTLTANITDHGLSGQSSMVSDIRTVSEDVAGSASAWLM